MAYQINHKKKKTIQISNCKDRVGIPRPKNEQVRAQKAQNNKFVESELENWARMSWMANKVDSNDKNRNVDGFQLEKVILGLVRGDQFLYIYLKYDYTITS